MPADTDRPELPVRIGICAVFEAARWSFWHDKAALIPASYHRVVVRAGALDIPLVPDPRVIADPDLLLDIVDGLLVIGGVDVDPARYGEEGEAELEVVDGERDDFEVALMRRALEREIPLLGICRGMQVLNVALGGSLTQDLGSEANQLHRPHLGTFVGTEHEVDVADSSLAARAAGGGRQVVHSHHHQAIDRLGRDLAVSATAADGVIEAVETRGGSFALGVQWHPEADEHSEVIAALVRAAEAARRSRVEGGAE
ncbi:MAG: gamma-glutamyl-gamma-aminobutyrate hydrolase family protein [Actinobacteria bacterium]|nr:gamma-glutamyl-gamma-aminobutyrate hydrolase family protein [Actinomycetota bacterium]